MSLPTPSMTLYVSNLETKTKKPELHSQLYSLFTPYGRVIDIIAKKHDGGRGQAFVTFDEQAAATSAMRALHGELFYSKELKITYSRNPSNSTIARTNPDASREAAAVRAAKLTVSNAQGEYEQLEKDREAEELKALGGKRNLEDGDQGDGEPAAKRAKGDEADDEEMEIEMDMDDEDAEGSEGKDGKSVVCTNLPPECNEQIMSALYSQYPGFSRAGPLPSSRSAPSSHPAPNPGAKSFLITFETAEQAKGAVSETKAYLMQPGWEMGVSVDQ
ncbi:RNA-binding domain-containing protein [Dioszegia hungarica]|uniref:RNA-binding domain-containing protein n=1 Tax=Dioszegia hungarica TaxID=4972 RepID=A0AA38HEF1_9TREE|nr:RNA-binding domain-containing protein [Dioszegia hungarica]KAI9638557.1 RNA-binding domain-containing protein [Dioszegia hungarica]